MPFSNSTSGQSVTTVPVVQVFYASGTYTPTPGMQYCIIELLGGGGSAGSAAATASNQLSVGGGGGAGLYLKALVTAAQIGASQPVTIGAGGSFAPAGSNGNAGGNSSVGTGLVAGGGSGGAGGGVTTTVLTAAGGAGGVALTGSTGTLLLVIWGQPGAASSVDSATNWRVIGAGGSTLSGVSPSTLIAPSPAQTSSVAFFGMFGAGSSGTYNPPNSPGLASTNGEQGVVVITEYF